jgi:hypothetical protein
MSRILLCGALGTILIGGVYMSQTALAASAFTPASIISTQTGSGVVFKYKEAGIQFVVPPGWEIELDNGTVTLSKQQGGSFIVAAMSTLSSEALALTPEAQFKAAAEGGFSDAKKDYKDFKLSEPTKDSQNGMPLMRQAFAGKQDGIDLGGSLILIQASKPVLIFVSGTIKNSDDFKMDVGRLLSSIKKI